MNGRFEVTRNAAVALIVLSGAAAVVGAAAWTDVREPRRPSRIASVGSAGAAAPVRFSRNGELLKPKGYRKWVYVGTPLTPHDMNGGRAAFPEFHSVYINPEAYADYAKTGQFPDGTVLVKELVSVGSKQASSGKGYFMGEFTGLEVAMKDRARFADEPGHWAYFSFGHEYPLADRAKAQPVANCNVCHSTAGQDYVFTQYYPVLRDAVADEKAE